MYQRQVDVDMLNAVNSVLTTFRALALRQSPTHDLKNSDSSGVCFAKCAQTLFIVQNLDDGFNRIRNYTSKWQRPALINASDPVFNM